MEYSEMQNHVGVLLGDTSNTFFTLTEIKNMLNRVQASIGAEAEALLTYYDYDTVASTQQYSLPAEYLTMKHVELHMDATSTRIEKLTFLNIDEFHAMKDNNEDVYERGGVVKA